jgi:hypothetical protein
MHTPQYQRGSKVVRGNMQGSTHQPVIQELSRAYFLVLSIAAQ